MADFLEQLIRPGDQIISIVGGGGKTTLMFYLAASLQQRGDAVISSTTTRIIRPTKDQSEELILNQDDPKGFLRSIEQGLQHFGHVTVASELLSGDKLKGLECQELEAIADHCPHALLLIEADGARCCSLKAPGQYEPVVSIRSDTVLAVLGLDCIGKTLDAKHVFRPELVAQRTEQALGSVISPHTLAQLIAHPQGLLKGCPPGARTVVVLNKIDIAGGRDLALEVFTEALDAGEREPDLWFAASVRDGVFEKMGPDTF